MPATKATRLVIVGSGEEMTVGRHLLAASIELGVPTRVCDIREAFGGPALLRSFSWHLRGHRPSRLGEFSKKVAFTCEEFRATDVIFTGLSPVDGSCLAKIRRGGMRTLCFLTDDPWNHKVSGSWFFRSLPEYDIIFSPRRANLEDLAREGGREVRYLPFAYAPEVHYAEQGGKAHDVFFAGGADPDRIPFFAPLLARNWGIGLYGGYWDRFPATRPYALGMATAADLRKLIPAAKVCPALVRRANRDGHVMRSYELPAMSGCVVAEDTAEHREMFGEEGDTTIYFRDPRELAARVEFLLDNPAERERLRSRCHQRIAGGQNRYRDRLDTMLGA